MNQQIITSTNEFEALDNWISANNISKLFLVCDTSFQFLTEIRKYIEQIEETDHTPSGTELKVVRFDDFQPNPLYDSVVKGVKLFRESGSDAIMAVGGGSAMDVAKCIKLYSNMDSEGAEGAFLRIDIVPNDVPFIAMPTTAGTGSEATRYAVIYYEGKKQSVADLSAIPGTVLMDSSVLKTLPEYQKKSTMMDAFCHSIESFWSVNSTEESKGYSRQALKIIMDNMDGYLANSEDGNSNMLLAANLAGKAINITQTTAGHAMCYKLTSLYGIAHGHAAALCVSVLWPYMIGHTNLCIDSRGQEYLDKVFLELAYVMGENSPFDGFNKFNNVLNTLCLEKPQIKDNDYEVLTKSVNPVRLKNNPIALDKAIIDFLYHRMMEK